MLKVTGAAEWKGSGLRLIGDTHGLRRKIACGALDFIIVAIFKDFGQVPASSEKCWTIMCMLTATSLVCQKHMWQSQVENQTLFCCGIRQAL